jgi:hypothetical protein
LRGAPGAASVRRGLPGSAGSARPSRRAARDGCRPCSDASWSEAPTLALRRRDRPRALRRVRIGAARGTQARGEGGHRHGDGRRRRPSAGGAPSGGPPAARPAAACGSGSRSACGTDRRASASRTVDLSSWCACRWRSPTRCSAFAGSARTRSGASGAVTRTSSTPWPPPRGGSPPGCDARWSGWKDTRAHSRSTCQHRGPVERPTVLGAPGPRLLHARRDRRAARAPRGGRLDGRQLHFGLCSDPAIVPDLDPLDRAARRGFGAPRTVGRTFVTAGDAPGGAP